jgi:6,7-dimethyl-8-ribityllumazine synthase
MATAAHREAGHTPADVPSGKGRRFALVVSRWNIEITDALRQGAYDTLVQHGVDPADIVQEWVPGSFELPAGAQFLLARGGLDGVICLGSVVRGETPHFDYVCQGVTQGVMAVGLKYGVPVIFGVSPTIPWTRPARAAVVPWATRAWTVPRPCSTWPR